MDGASCVADCCNYVAPREPSALWRTTPGAALLARDKHRQNTSPRYVLLVNQAWCDQYGDNMVC